MAEEENIDQEQVELGVPEMWALAKPPVPETNEDDDEPKNVVAPGAKIGKLIKLLNDIEEQEELDTKVQELDPATGQSLLLWATLEGKFVVVEWLVKKCKRAAFAFSAGKEITIYDKWVEIRKEIEEREREKAENPPEEEEAADDEEKAPEPTADQLVYEALSEFHEEWGTTGQGIVKAIGELGFYHGARDSQYNKTGLGKTLFPNGDMYTGQYVNNQRQGRGTYLWVDRGVIYTGQWNNNLRHGLGRIVYPDGGRYYGAWSFDSKNGEGRYTYPDGSSYNGSWENDVKHGFGTYSFTDGSSFVGSFVDGSFVSGEWRLCGATRYHGTFRNDKPYGAGVFTFKYGLEGSYRQDGQYLNGKWVPGKISTVTDVPVVSIPVQKKIITLTFSDECGALLMEHLAQVINFEPFATWIQSLANIEASVQSIVVTGAAFAADKSVEEVRVKAVFTAADGKKVRGTDNIILKKPSTRLLVLLVGGDKTLALVETSVSAARGGTSSSIRLPTIRARPDGKFSGAFITAVENSDLRLRIDSTTTTRLLAPLYSGAATTSAKEDVLLYIQHLHADAIATIAERVASMQQQLGVDEALTSFQAIRLSEVIQQSGDGITIAAASQATRLLQSDKLPRATVEDQRPPTPIPPAALPRPKLEPLLEEQKRNEARVASPQDAEE